MPPKKLTASEIFTSLKIEADTDLVTQLDKQLAKEPPIQPERKKNVKFVFVSNGDYAIVAGIYVKTDVETLVEVGRATSLKKGSGVLWTTYVAFGLSGGYKIKFTTGTAKLYSGDEQIWFWLGELAGLDGFIDIVLDYKALSVFANAVFPATP